MIVPTYKEVANLPLLIDRVARLRETSGLEIEQLIMDDDSRDGSVELVKACPEPWVQLVVRMKSAGSARPSSTGFVARTVRS